METNFNLETQSQSTAATAGQPHIRIKTSQVPASIQSRPDASLRPPTGISISLLADLGLEMRSRKIKNRLITISLWSCMALVLAVLGSIGWQLLTRGIGIISPYFLTVSMKGVYGGMNAGGIYHAILGSLLITGAATIISVPFGLAVATYLVEYAGNTRFAKITMTLVDVMTGIPSIVAGLFSAALFTLTVGPAYRAGIMAAVALSVLMVPIVIRGSVELLRLVPQDLREASYALGIPKWRTIISVVLRTAAPGLLTSIMISIARVIGETAPILITAGIFNSINSNLFDGRMMTLPVYIYDQYIANVSCAAGAVNCNPFINLERAWGAALVLVIGVMLLNLGVRALARVLSSKV